MKVEYREVTDEAVYDMTPVQLTELANVQFCCPDMTTHWNNHDIAFEKGKVMFMWHDYVEDHDDSGEFAICYCPFCGEKIEVIKTKSIRRIFDPDDPERQIITWKGRQWSVKRYDRKTITVEF